MNEKRKFKEFELSGVVNVGSNQLEWEKFMDAFLSMIEKRGWSYGGGLTPLDENGDVADVAFLEPQNKPRHHVVSSRCRRGHG